MARGVNAAVRTGGRWIANLRQRGFNLRSVYATDAAVNAQNRQVRNAIRRTIAMARRSAGGYGG